MPGTAFFEVLSNPHLVEVIHSFGAESMTLALLDKATRLALAPCLKAVVIPGERTESIEAEMDEHGVVVEETVVVSVTPPVVPGDRVPWSDLSAHYLSISQVLDFSGAAISVFDVWSKEMLPRLVSIPHPRLVSLTMRTEGAGKEWVEAWIRAWRFDALPSLKEFEWWDANPRDDIAGEVDTTPLLDQIGTCPTTTRATLAVRFGFGPSTSVRKALFNHPRVMGLEVMGLSYQAVERRLLKHQGFTISGAWNIFLESGHRIHPPPWYYDRGYDLVAMYLELHGQFPTTQQFLALSQQDKLEDMASRFGFQKLCRCLHLPEPYPPYTADTHDDLTRLWKERYAATT